MPDRATELRLRRRAERQGLRLEKSRLRDPDAFEFNTYRLVDQTTGAIVAMGGSGGFGLTLEQIEARLTKRSGIGTSTSPDARPTPSSRSRSAGGWSRPSTSRPRERGTSRA